MSLDYLRVLVTRKPGLAKGARIPRIEQQLPAEVAAPQRLAAMRKLTEHPDHGFLPVTFPHVASFPAHFQNLLDARFPLPVMGLIHVRSRILQHRPIGAGEAVRSVCFIEGNRETEKGLEFDLETLAYVESEIVWRSKATMLSRKKAPSSRKSMRSESPDGVGAVNAVWRIPASTARAYALASGDLNPIHLSSLTARLFGFSGVVAHGMWSLTRIAGIHASLVNQPDVKVSCDFKLPLILPAQAVYRHWPVAGGIEFRLLDKRAEKPHASGTIITGIKEL